MNIQDVVTLVSAYAALITLAFAVVFAAVKRTIKLPAGWKRNKYGSVQQTTPKTEWNIKPWTAPIGSHNYPQSIRDVEVDAKGEPSHLAVALQHFPLPMTPSVWEPDGTLKKIIPPQPACYHSRIRLAKLLRDAQQAHHRYEELQKMARPDDNWPEWYAAYIAAHWTE